MKIRNHCLCSWFVILLAAILLVPAHAQFIQQGPKLTGTNYFGISGGISTDGNTAVVGAGDGAFVYVRINGVWSQQGPELGGASGYYCQAVALSEDGNTVMVGFYDGNIDSIRVRVFIRTNGVWSQQGPDLLPSGRYGYLFAALLGISRDGNTAIIGAELPGEAWIYVRNNKIWSQQGPEFSFAGAEGEWNGLSVALSADGNTAIVGAPYDGPNPDEPDGAAFIFVRRNGVWTQQGNKLVGSGGYRNPDVGIRQGSSVALSADGSTALVGGPYDIDGPGSAWVFTRNTNTGEWRQQGPKLYDKDTAAPYDLGQSVSLSADGNTATLAGAEPAAAVVFTRRNGAWTQQSSKVVGTGAMSEFSWVFVALSGDGNTLLMGDSDYNGAGEAWFFIIPKTGPSPAWTRLSVPVGVPGGVSTNGPDRNFEAINYGAFRTNGSMFTIGALGGNILTYDGKLVNRAVAGTGFESVAFSDNGAAAAGADKGFIYRSTDGMSWSGQQIGSNNVNGIAYGGNGVFVAVESGGHISRSSDYGVTWTEQLNSGQLWTTHDLTGVAFGYSSTLGAVFVIVATGGQTLYSTDYGVTWHTVDLTQYFPCGVSPYDTPHCTVGPLGPALNLQGVAFGHDEFVAVADSGAVFVSKDGGQTWSWTFLGPAAAAVPLQGVAYGSGSNQEYFVAAGKNGVTLIGPVDPLTGEIGWYATSFPTTYLRGVAFGENKFVAAGYGATIIQSKPLPW